MGKRPKKVAPLSLPFVEKSTTKKARTMELLRQLYLIQSHSGSESEMRTFLIQFVKRLGLPYRVDEMGNLYVCKGDGPIFPCLAAHMDEVHRFRSDYRVEFQNGFIYGYSDDLRCGIGADDKNGIWTLLNCLAANDVPNLKCAFFVEEEYGCLGSQEAEMEFFTNCRYVLEIDRRYKDQFIVENQGVPLCSKEFVAALPLVKYGYAPAVGGHTDVCHLKKQGLAVCAANVSCGYYNPHLPTEKTNVADLRNCLEFVREIILTQTAVFPHRFEEAYNEDEND